MDGSMGRTLRNQTYDELVKRITSGELHPGSQIDEKQLIAELGVSRTPFREAIAKLASDGLVEGKPYRGFSVREFSAKEINDLYALRRTLECFAIKLAVDNISNVDIDRLERILNRGVSALEVADLAGYAVHDQEFHGMIARLSGSQPLIEVLERLSLQVAMCRGVANREPGFASQAAVERDAILDALRVRDAASAAMLLDAHIAHSQNAVLRSLPEFQNQHDIDEQFVRQI